MAGALQFSGRSTPELHYPEIGQGYSMREVNVLVPAELGWHANALVSPLGILKLLRWDDLASIPEFVGAVWAIVPRALAPAACALLRDDARTRSAHITLVTRPGEPLSAEARTLGADDAIVGPVAPSTLTGHFERICEGLAGDGPAGVVRAGPLTLDLRSYLACWQGRPIRLSLTEFRILAYFLGNPGRVVSRTELAEMLGRSGEVLSDPVVTGWVGRLVRKLRAADVPDPVQGLRGRGYRFLPPA